MKINALDWDITFTELFSECADLDTLDWAYEQIDSVLRGCRDNREEELENE